MRGRPTPKTQKRGKEKWNENVAFTDISHELSTFNRPDNA